MEITNDTDLYPPFFFLDSDAIPRYPMDFGFCNVFGGVEMAGRTKCANFGAWLNLG